MGKHAATEADLNYIGGIVIDQDLLDAADIHQENVQVVNILNVPVDPRSD